MHALAAVERHVDRLAADLSVARLVPSVGSPIAKLENRGLGREAFERVLGLGDFSPLPAEQNSVGARDVGDDSRTCGRYRLA
jgi:hypothetical protein